MFIRSLSVFLLSSVVIGGLAPLQVLAADAIDSGTNTADSLNTGTTSATSIGNSTGTTTINGPTSINGGHTTTTINNSGAVTSVTSGASVLGAGTTNMESSLANSGASGVVVDSNGKMMTGMTTETTAAMVVTNGLGNTHGFAVTEHAATMSGGTTSNSLTINDAGATFANSTSGAPVKVTGVADGTSQYDAVNYGQIQGFQSQIQSVEKTVDTMGKNLSGGIASVAALAAMPDLDKGKKFAISMGTGYFDSQAGLAFGFSGRFNKRVVGRVGLSLSPTSPDHNAVANAGISYAW